jgi:NAD(P)-dependent dehydrogenase (short-subunit alcohol dehydrogenase family)
VVVVSSAGHQFGGLDLDDMHFRRRSYGKIKAYGQSKMCNILFAKELARR